MTNHSLGSFVQLIPKVDKRTKM